MPRHQLKLLVLSTAFAVAPATAGNRAGITGEDFPAVAPCPYEQAKLAEAALADRNDRTPTTITLIGSGSIEQSARGIAARSLFTP